jgi:hypothetical protein
VLASQSLAFAHQSSRTYGHGLDALDIIDPRDGNPVEGNVVAHGEWREEMGFEEDEGLGNDSDSAKSVDWTMVTIVEVF